LSSGGLAASGRNWSWLSPPICTSATSVNPASQYALTDSTIAHRRPGHAVDVVPVDPWASVTVSM